MGRLALAGGSSFLGSGGAPPFEADLERIEVPTEYGSVAVLEAGDFVFLQRHGLDDYLPPQRIDHRANLAALLALGCDRVLAICSVGSLHAELGVGTIVCPDDFIALHLGVLRLRRRARPPRARLRPRLAATRCSAAWTEHDPGPLRDGGVYWQAIGPRFETAGRDPADRRPRRRRRDDDRPPSASSPASWGSPTPRSASSTTSPTGSPRARSPRPSSRPGGTPNREPPADRRSRRSLPALDARRAVSLSRGAADRPRRALDGDAGRAALRGRHRSRRSAPTSSPQPGDEVIDAAGAPLVPALVNGHTHAAMTLFRGYGGDLPLMRWLRGEDLAGRGAARGRGRLLGHPARLPGDDPHRDRPLLGHVLAAGGDRAGGRPTPACGRRSARR